MPTIEEIIAHFGMDWLPVEGGYFVQTYQSDEFHPAGALPGRGSLAKPFGTAILYLLTPDPDVFSALHRLPSEEVYHFYAGDPVELLHLHPDGRGQVITLGPDFMHGHKIQHVARRGVWQGSRLRPGGTWALLGTTMAPGYTDGDYEGGDRDALIAAYPAFADLIRSLTRPDQPLHIG